MPDPRDKAWEAYVEKHSKPDPEGEESHPVEILEVGHAISFDELPPKIKAHVKVMADPEMKRSVTFERGVPFKTGKRAGEPRPDKQITHIGLRSVCDDYLLTAVWSDDKLQYAKFWDRHERDAIRYTESINELKGWIKNAQV